MDIIANQWIPSQFPSHYKKDGPLFIAFIKAYYEFLESQGQPLYHSRKLLDYADIDKTPDNFIQYFKDEYLQNLPINMLSDQRFLIKHILDLYRAKGTKRGYELLFRILFNEDIQLYYPGKFVFKPSDNTWVLPRYLEVTSSSFNPELVGLSIYSSTNGGSALVESFNVVNINNKIVNVLTISNLIGNFDYGSFVLSSDVPSLNVNNAPSVIGSLIGVSVEEGGALYNIGDLVNIFGNGSTALGRVSSITQQNGKVIFTLENGGFGFSISPQIQVTGGGGSGATFQVGSIIDKETFILNIDQISTYYNTQLDNAADDFTLNISNTNGAFTVSEVVNTQANGIGLDFAYLSGNNLSNGEILSNTSLGINNLTIIEIDNPNFVNLTGPQASLINANLVSGTILKGSVSLNTIYINSVLPLQDYLANATVTFANSSVVKVNQANGYFLPTSTLFGQSSAANAYINSTIRDTSWSFPTGGGNLDQSMFNTLTYETLVVGTIASLTAENPGDLYSANPNVSIIEPLIYALQIPDGSGGFLGGDANVVGIANSSNGIATSISIVDSGYGFTPGEQLTISSNNPISIVGTAIVDGAGISQGYWTSNKSFPSDQIFLEDSYYYQPFSYEIQAPRMMDTYHNFVMDIVHPINLTMFGRFVMIDKQTSNVTLLASSTSYVNNYIQTYPTYYIYGF